MKNKQKKFETWCPVETTVKAIGGRWKVLIIYHLSEEPRRFGELSRLLNGIAARTLTRQLRELESSGVINRKDFKQIPPKVVYSLSEIGKKLQPVLIEMHKWGEDIEAKRGILEKK